MASLIKESGMSKKTGRSVINMDLSEIEQRVAARLIKDEGCPDPVDIHKNRAAELFDVHPDDVTPEQRRFAKSSNYLELYGVNRSTTQRFKRYSSDNLKK